MVGQRIGNLQIKQRGDGVSSPLHFYQHPSEIPAAGLIPGVIALAQLAHLQQRSVFDIHIEAKIHVRISQRVYVGAQNAEAPVRDVDDVFVVGILEFLFFVILRKAHADGDVRAQPRQTFHRQVIQRAPVGQQKFAVRSRPENHRERAAGGHRLRYRRVGYHVGREFYVAELHKKPERP